MQTFLKLVKCNVRSAKIPVSYSSDHDLLAPCAWYALVLCLVISLVKYPRDLWLLCAEALNLKGESGPGTSSRRIGVEVLLSEINHAACASRSVELVPMLHLLRGMQTRM